jgi:hypothetical protein
MADPAYIVNGVLTDGEAWVPIQSIEPTANFEWASTDDGQVGDWSQYMDLKVIGYYRTSQAAVNINLTMNFNNANDAFAYQIFRGNGQATAGLSGSVNGRWDPGEGCGASATANHFSAITIDIFDINSGKFKYSFATGGSGDNTDTNSYATVLGSCWKSTAPITAIDFWSRSGGTFVTGSRFDLFGILPRMVA